MASFEEKFNDLLNFVRLLVKRDTENYEEYKDGGCISLTSTWPSLMWRMKHEQLIPTSHSENDPSPKGNWNTLEGPQSLQMYGNGEENVMNKKEDDHSDIRSLQGQPLYPSNQGDTIEPHSDVDGHSSKGSKESEKEAQSPISKKEEPKEVDHPMIPHKRHTPKNVVERVEQLEKQLDEVVQSMHQLITLTGTLLKDDRKAIRDLASHSPIGQASTKSLSKRETRRHRRQETLMLHTGRYQSGPKSFFRRKTKVRIKKIFPHLLHDSSKKCEFHFGRPGHSLEDCHALKNKVQDLVDHGILRINEGSTPSVIIAWPPEHRKDETVIPSPQSQGPTTCGIQPVHLTTLPTLSEVGEHTLPKTQPKLMSNFRNLDDQCSSDKEKAEYCTNRCVTLKRKIQELGHSELEVPVMVQARKPSMHTVPMKKARSTLGFRANEPSRDQTERTILRSTGAWIPHRQG
uniref:Retrotransposon gag domain-containing protein n=1 Tax=Fagus sylvatica TaxID=28930 RepID=A0A2N9HRY6_FAGSY